MKKISISFIKYHSTNVTVNIEKKTIKYLISNTLRFINSVKLSSSVLRLVVNVLIMLLRNLYLKKDLCNETRLMIIKVCLTLLKIKILNNAMHDEIRLILRITLITLKNNYSFILKR